MPRPSTHSATHNANDASQTQNTASTSNGEGQLTSQNAGSLSASEGRFIAEPPATSPPEFREFGRVAWADSDQNIHPFTYYAPTPTATTGITTASSDLPLTPRSPDPRGWTGTASRPVQGRIEEEQLEPPNTRSTFGFAFRPPSGPAPPQTSETGSEPTAFSYGVTSIDEDETRDFTGVRTSFEWEESSNARTKTAGTLSEIASGSYSRSSTGKKAEVLEQTVSASPSEKSESGELTLPVVEAGLGGEIVDDEEDSPYPEVRASVSNVDDPDMPCFTFRVLFLGLGFSILGAAASMFLWLRSPSFALSGIGSVVAAYGGGKVLEKLLPIRTWSIGGYEFSLNPCPFNIKEHAMIYMLSGLVWEFGVPTTSMSSIIVWETKYHQSLSLGYQYAYVISSQLLGIGLAGLSHRLLVWPAEAIWPTTLPVCATLNFLHAEGYDFRPYKGPSQVKIFTMVTSLACIWAFVPGFLFTGLSYFTFLCWIFPQNKIVNQVFGSISGLGMNFVTFDWSQISFAGSPLMIPFWAQIHVFVAFVIVYWVMAPALYYSDVWKTGHLPIYGGTAYDRFANPYNVTRVLDPAPLRLNLTAYKSYSPVYIPVTFAMTYLLAFAIPPAVLVHSLLAFGPKFLRKNKNSDPEPEDIHAKLIRRYPQVPWWWYAGAFALAVTLAFGSTFAHSAQGVSIPVVLFAIVIATIWSIPACHISAISGQVAGINLVAQSIPGILWPGNPLVNMVFKTYSVEGISVGAFFVRGLKFGHYMKIPPRYSFIALTTGAVITVVVELAAKEIIFAGVHDICTPDQPARLICSHTHVAFTASVVWGLIGPKREFGRGAVYYGEIYALIAGAAVPLMLWLWRYYRPLTRLRKVNFAIALTVSAYTPPGTGINYVSSFLVGIATQWYWRSRNSRSWARYNWISAAALDAGTGIGIFLCFLLLQLPKDLSLNWWGNNVWQQTLDAQGVAYYSTDPNTGF